MNNFEQAIKDIEKAQEALHAALLEQFIEKVVQFATRRKIFGRPIILRGCMGTWLLSLKWGKVEISLDAYTEEWSDRYDEGIAGAEELLGEAGEYGVSPDCDIEITVYKDGQTTVTRLSGAGVKG